MSIVPSDLPSQIRLHELFDYHDDGRLIWKRKGWKGLFAGCLQSNGRYVQVGVDGKLYLLHRLIFMWHHGWCPDEVDHRDRNKLNCRIQNLKPSDHHDNGMNRGINANNTTGVRGVSFIQGSTKPFRAQPKRYGVAHRLGSFATVEEAAAAIVQFNA